MIRIVIGKWYILYFCADLTQQDNPNIDISAWISELWHLKLKVK